MALSLAGSYEGYGFKIAQATAIMAAGLAAASEIYQFRWTSTATRARILGVQFSAAVDTTAFTAGAAIFDMTVARAWTVDGSGGAAATFAGANQLRTSQQPSRGAGSRIATTAALGAGTKVLDAQPVGVLVGGAGATAGSQIVVPSDFYVDEATSYGIPLVLANQEGFVIRSSVPVVGTWKAGVTVFWAEVD